MIKHLTPRSQDELDKIAMKILFKKIIFAILTSPLCVITFVLSLIILPISTVILFYMALILWAKDFDDGEDFGGDFWFPFWRVPFFSFCWYLTFCWKIKIEPLY